MNEIVVDLPTGYYEVGGCIALARFLAPAGQDCGSDYS